MRTAELDVVVVTFRSLSCIRTCIERARSIPVRQVVVVDHGDEGLGGVLAGLNVQIERQKNVGFGAGINLAVRECAAPFVLVLNPDATVVPDAIAEGVRFLQQREDAGAVQGVIVNRASRYPERSAGGSVRPIHLVGRSLGFRRLLRSRTARGIVRAIPGLRDHVSRVPDGATEVEWLAATALLVRRAAFSEIGGFDEAYFLYGEDLDLCARLCEAGWKLHALPEVWAEHTSGGSAESAWQRELHWWQGTLRFAALRWTGPAWAFGVVAAVIRWVGLAVQRPALARVAFRAVVLKPMRDRSEGKAPRKPNQESTA